MSGRLLRAAIADRWSSPKVPEVERRTPTQTAPGRVRRADGADDVADRDVHRRDAAGARADRRRSRRRPCQPGATRHLGAAARHGGRPGDLRAAVRQHRPQAHDLCGPRPVRLRLCAVGRGRQPAADAAGSHPAGLRRRGAAHRRGGARARRVRRRRHGAPHVPGAHDLHPGADGGAGARPGHPAGRALAGDLRHAAGTGPGRAGLVRAAPAGDPAARAARALLARPDPARRARDLRQSRGARLYRRRRHDLRRLPRLHHLLGADLLEPIRRRAAVSCRISAGWRWRSAPPPT